MAVFTLSQVEFSEQKLLVGQRELEEKFLVLTETQKEIIFLLLKYSEPLPVTYLRLIIYVNKMVAKALENFKGSAVKMYKQKEQEGVFGLLKSLFSFKKPDKEVLEWVEQNLKHSSDQLEKDLHMLIQKMGSMKAEKHFRTATKTHPLLAGLKLPSNSKIDNDLNVLKEKNLITIVLLTSPKRSVGYVIEPSFFSEWNKYRIEIKKMKKEWFTDFQKRFWQI